VTSIRTFRTVCDVCLRELDGELRLEGDLVYHCKECPEHGPRRWLVSRNGGSYARFDRHYHAVFPAGEAAPPPEDIRFFITSACNLGCDYCALESNRHRYFETYDLARFAAELRAFPGPKVSLIGGEPLCHPRFFEFLGCIERAGKTAVVCSNGLALANESVVRRLVEVSRGRCEVRMTFEGFAPEDYEALPPVADLRETKLAALATLERVGVSVTLAHTISTAEQADPERLRRVLAALARYAMEKSFIHGLTVQAITAVGAARDLPGEGVMSVDAVTDAIVAACPVPVARSHAYLAQELLHLVSRVFDLPLCEYRQAVILLRPGEEWVGLDHFFDCDRLQRRLEARAAHGPASRPELLRRLLVDLLASARPLRLPALVRMGVQLLPLFVKRWDYASIPHCILPLNAGTNCDRYNLDQTVAHRCEKTFHTQRGDEVWKEPGGAMFIRHLHERLAPAAPGRGLTPAPGSGSRTP
jgi:uncharacterized Fe-S cluster-containing radical SAM superfamily protein